MPLSGVRYRYKKGTHIRLAFRGNRVVEAKNMKTGKIHTPAEFEADRYKRKKRKKTLIQRIRSIISRRIK